MSELCTGEKIIRKDNRMNNKMPELKAGDVVCTDGGVWYLCISPAHFYALRRDDERREVGLMYHTTISQLIFEITRVYRREGYFEVGGKCESLYSLLSDPDSEENSSALIWSAKPAVREMTVDEISEALGYKVKVVGDGLQ